MTAHRQPNILIVDDNPENLRLLVSILKEQGYKVRPARDGVVALNSAFSNPPDLILLDILMPRMDGYETCQKLKADERTKHIPVIFISALSDSFDKVKAFDVGCEDFIGKPFNTDELLARITSRIALQRSHQKLEEKNARLQCEVKERKRAERYIKESEKRFATVMNSMESIMYVADMQTYELLFINEFTRNLFGDIVGEVCWKVLQKGQEGPCPFCTNRYLIKNGQPIGVYSWNFQNTVTGNWYHIQDQAVNWTDGRLVRLEIATDITEMKKAEDSLRRRNDYLNALHETALDLIQRQDLGDLLQNILSRAVALANVSDGFIHLYDPDLDMLEIRYAVGDYAKHIGFRLKPGEGLAGRIWQTGESLLVKDYRNWSGRATNPAFDGIRSIVGFPLKSGQRTEGVIGLGHNDSTRLLDRQEAEILEHFTHLASLALDNAYLYLGMQKEIAERKKAVEAAETANKAKSAFLSNMSHELRSPLNAVLGYANILQRDASERQKDGLDIIKQSGNHLLSLINDVLDLAKVESGKIECFDTDFLFYSFLNGVAKMVRLRAEAKGLDFKFEADEKKLPLGVRCDDRRLRQVLLNLLNNAVNYTETGGIVFKVEKKVEKIRFTVQDTGIGIAPQDLEKVFEPFYQVGLREYQSGGTGLGLAISRTLTELLGGELKAESQPGAGSRFYFELHLPEASLGIEPVDIEKREIIGFQGEAPMVMIVDDNNSNRAVFTGMLEPLGFKIMEAGNSRQLFDKTIQSVPDIFIIDLYMPDLNGFELIRRIRRSPKLKAKPIIATSASVYRQDQLKSRACGANTFLPKPVEVNVLLDQLRDLLNLKWLYHDKELQNGNVKNALPFVAPPAETLDTLIALAEIGDIYEIQTIIENLKRSDIRYKPFSDKLLHLVRTFEIDEIDKMLRLYQKAPA